MFCQFLLHSKVTQLYIHIHFFFTLPSIMFHRKRSDIVPSAIQQNRIAFLKILKHFY